VARTRFLIHDRDGTFSDAFDEVFHRLLILSRRHLERVLRIYAEHYNRERPRRALALKASDPIEPTPASRNAPVQRREQLGGLLDPSVTSGSGSSLAGRGRK
jgi:hypothetical protein